MIFELEEYLENLLKRPINLKQKKDFSQQGLPEELIILEDIDLEAVIIGSDLHRGQVHGLGCRSDEYRVKTRTSAAAW